MLKEILSGESCAKCRFCCVFDKDDIWEAPVIFKELQEYIEKNHGTQPYISNGKAEVFDMDFDEKGLAKCPMLTEKGCKLGDNKPFDCKIWPFRVMQKDNLLLLTVIPTCGEVSSLPLSRIINFVNSEFGDIVLDIAEKNPQMIKDYIENTPIFKVRKAK